MYRNVKITRGNSGWGGPLVIAPTETCNKILCVTTGGVNPLAKKIGEMTGCEVLDGFKTTAPDEQICLAVIDCGGVARCGVYCKKGIKTVNLVPVGKSGPLAQFIVEELYVSDVKEENITFTDETVEQPAASEAVAEEKPAEEAPKTTSEGPQKKPNIITRIGIGVGKVVNKFFAAGRETIDMVIKNVLPFMAFTSTILGIISYSGLGDVIANTISPMCSTLPGMLVISLVCALPFLSPILGPGAVIAQVVGTLLGAQIGLGNIPAQFALPALFAIDAQVGGDFVPVGLSLGEAEPETIEYGVPAVLYSRVITGPLAVAIAFVFSIGLYS